MAAALKTKFRDMVCGECHRVFITNQPRKLFCDACGVKRRQGDSARTVTTRRRGTAPGLARIAAEAEGNALSMIDALFAPKPCFAWSAAFTIPFSMDVSKNRRWSTSGYTVAYLSKGVRAYEAALIAKATEALRGMPLKHAKLWVGIHVQKPNHRIDAVNAVDTICDAIKKAAGVDDRWFCIERVDWEVRKLNPRIYVRLSQEAEEDMQVCSHCGGIKVLAEFSKKKGGWLGIDRVCRSCRSIIREEGKRVVVEALQ